MGKLISSSKEKRQQQREAKYTQKRWERVFYLLGQSDLRLKKNPDNLRTNSLWREGVNPDGNLREKDKKIEKKKNKQKGCLFSEKNCEMGLFSLVSLKTTAKFSSSYKDRKKKTKEKKKRKQTSKKRGPPAEALQGA